MSFDVTIPIILEFFLQWSVFKLGQTRKKEKLFLTCSHVEQLFSINKVSLIAQMVKNLLAVQETQVQSLDREDPLEKEMATHSCILAWKIPWTEEPGGLQSMGVIRVRHDWATDQTHRGNWEELENVWSRVYKRVGDNIFFQPVIVKVECPIQFLILRLCPSHFLSIKKSFPYEVVMLVHTRFFLFVCLKVLT